jgi:hypothetical protein
MAPSSVIVCDLAALASGDIATVGGLARLVLEARRTGFELRFTGAAPELRELIVLAGLEETLLEREPPWRPRGGSVVEARRQAKQGEQALGVEKERELDEPPV